MGKPERQLGCSEEDRQELERRLRSQKGSRRDAERAKIILGLLSGKSQAQVSRELGLRPNTVNKWAHRFEKEGMAGGAFWQAKECGQRSEGAHDRDAELPSSPRSGIVGWG